jgi:hypothetical protein
MEHATQPPAPPPDLADTDVLHLGHLRRAFTLLERLHDDGCARDKAGNRKLHFDDYCKLVLLYIWNPLIDSLRTLQQAVGLPRVAKALGVGRFSLGSFSEAPAVFDPKRLLEVIHELGQDLRRVLPQHPRLADLKYALTLVDGTVLTALTRLAEAAAGAAGDTRYTTARDGRAVHGWRLHTQLDLASFTPHRIDRTGARNGGESRENNVLRRTLEPARCYVIDGGFADRTLFDDIVTAQSVYVSRMREDTDPDPAAVFEERLLDQAALDAGVVRDAVIDWGTQTHPVRIVVLQVQPHERRTRAGKKQSELIVLATCMLDLPPELVALIYLYRYTVELFFRTFKHLLGMRHLLSQRPAGIDIQVYCTVIVCLLINLMTGRRPDKAMVNIVGWYQLGLADEADLIAFLTRPDNRGVKNRAKDELRKKLGY